MGFFTSCSFRVAAHPNGAMSDRRIASRSTF
jgi:hypothetical protein